MMMHSIGVDVLTKCINDDIIKVIEAYFCSAVQYPLRTEDGRWKMGM